MARWKLMTPHYLHLVDPTEWEYNEQGRDGKLKRLKLRVPRYLDPRDPSDWNNAWGPNGGQEGEVIVCAPNTGHPRDYEFLGEPTPDMMPLDDEASAISAKFTERWAYKPENSDSSYSQSMIDRFQADMAEASAKPQKVEIEGLGDLLGAVQALVQHAAPSIRR